MASAIADANKSRSSMIMAGGKEAGIETGVGWCAAVLLGNVINGAIAGYSNRDRLEKEKSNSRLFKSLTQTIRRLGIWYRETLLETI